MRAPRLGVVVTAVIAFGALLAAPAWASTDQVVPETPKTDAGVAISPNPARAQGTITVDATGFKPATLVALDIAGIARLDRVTTDDNGALHASVVLPPSVGVGSHQVLVTGMDPSGAPRALSAALDVVDGFGNTGAPPLVWTTVALLVIVLGQAMLRLEQQLRSRRVLSAAAPVVLQFRFTAKGPASRPRLRLRPRRPTNRDPGCERVRLRRRAGERSPH